MSAPDFNGLYPPGRDLSPRMAYRVWWLSHALLAEEDHELRRRLPYLVSVTASPGSGFWERLHSRLHFFIAHLSTGGHEANVSLCTADDVLLHIILSAVEDGLLLGGDEVVGGDSQFLQFHSHQIDDCAQAYKTLVRNTEIWCMWDLGTDELLDVNWFDAQQLPLWEPVRWFEPHQR